MTLLVIALAFTGCQNQRPAKQNGFDSIRNAILKGDFDNSIPKLEDFIAQYPDSKDTSRAGLFLFKCHAALREFDKASQWCDWTIKNHSTSPEAHKCRYKLGLISLWKHDVESAKVQFASLADQPDGPLAAEAKRMLDFLEQTHLAKKETVGE